MDFSTGCLPYPLSHYVGVKFRPTDQQLLQYLNCKIYGLQYFKGAVFDCDLYGEIEPWEIWQHFEGTNGEDLYFFTKLKRSTTSSGRLSAHINRKIGLANGTWSGENSATPIFAIDDDETIIGYSKRFRYENDQLLEHHGEWIMHEYSLHPNYLMSEGADPNYVLCRMRKNERAKRKLEQCREFEQPRKKRISASKISRNQRPHTKANKRCFAELEPTEQRVMTPEMIYNEPIVPNMTTNQDMSVVAHVPDMFTNQDMSVLAHVPDTTTSQDMSVLAHVPDMTTNQNMSVEAYVPDMTNQNNIDLLDMPPVNANESMSFTTKDIPYMTTNDEWITFLNSCGINDFNFQPDI